MSIPIKRPHQGEYDQSRKKAEKEAYLSSPTYNSNIISIIAF